MSVGLHASMVSRHRRSGRVSENPEKNDFISVGTVRNIHRPALEKVYPGGYCEAALCSTKTGEARFLVCDCKGKRSHDLPAATGPNDEKNWDRVLKLSERAMEE